MSVAYKALNSLVPPGIFVVLWHDKSSQTNAFAVMCYACVALSLMVEAHIQGQRASASCDWVVKRFAGIAETLTAIQLTSRRDGGRCCAPRSSHPVTSWERRTTSPYEIRAATDEEWWRAECWKELQERMSMWASVCPSICHSECWKEWQCDTPFKCIIFLRSFFSLLHLSPITVFSKEYLIYFYKSSKHTLFSHNIANSFLSYQ